MAHFLPRQMLVFQDECITVPKKPIGGDRARAGIIFISTTLILKWAFDTQVQWILVI